MQSLGNLNLKTSQGITTHSSMQLSVSTASRPYLVEGSEKLLLRWRCGDPEAWTSGCRRTSTALEEKESLCAAHRDYAHLRNLIRTLKGGKRDGGKGL